MEINIIEKDFSFNNLIRDNYKPMEYYENLKTKPVYLITKDEDERWHLIQIKKGSNLNYSFSVSLEYPYIEFYKNILGLKDKSKYFDFFEEKEYTIQGELLDYRKFDFNSENEIDYPVNFNSQRLFNLYESGIKFSNYVHERDREDLYNLFKSLNDEFLIKQIIEKIEDINEVKTYNIFKNVSITYLPNLYKYIKFNINDGLYTSDKFYRRSNSRYNFGGYFIYNLLNNYENQLIKDIQDYLEVINEVSEFGKSFYKYLEEKHFNIFTKFNLENLNVFKRFGERGYYYCKPLRDVFVRYYNEKCLNDKPNIDLKSILDLIFINDNFFAPCLYSTGKDVTELIELYKKYRDEYLDINKNIEPKLEENFELMKFKELIKQGLSQ